MTSMRRKTLSLTMAGLMALALCVPVLTAAPRQAQAADHSVSTWDDLVLAVAAGGNINVTAEIEIKDTLVVTQPVNISGAKLLRSEDFDGTSSPFRGTMFFVSSMLGLNNITIDGNKDEITAAVQPMIIVKENGSLLMSNGATLQNNSNKAVLVMPGGGIAMIGGSIASNTNISNGTDIDGNGGGVSLYANSSFEMRGGTIYGNEASRGGGGVYVATGAIFKMSATATITGNTASNGGGVYNAGTFIMWDGTIEKNIAESEGGGVCNYGGTFLFEKGAITDCEADWGGGVSCKGGTFSMTDVAAIVNNKANFGGGVCTDSSSDGITRLGGEIEGNEAAKFGDGIYIYNGIVTLSGDTLDLANSVAVYSPNDDYFDLRGTPCAVTLEHVLAIASGGGDTAPAPAGTKYRVATAQDESEAIAWAEKFAPVAPGDYTFVASASDVWALKAEVKEQEKEKDDNKNTYGDFDAAPSGSAAGGLGSASAGNTGGSSSGAAGGETAAQTARVIATSLNLRSGGSLSASVLGKLPMNTVVEVLATTADGWVQIRLQDGRTGWVSGRYLVNLAPAAAGTVVTTTANLNLRTGPGMSNAVVRVAPKGSVFTLAGVSEDGMWGYVVENGVTLYMSMAYLA